MAIENNDLLVLQKNASGELRKATVSALLAEVVDSNSPNLQAVTDEGNTTTNDIELTGHLVCGQKIFGGAAVTNVGTEIHPTKGAIHVRPANDTDIAAIEVLGHDTEKSHFKVHGDGKTEFGNNIAGSEIGLTLRPDGTSTQNGVAKFNKGIDINNALNFGYGIYSYGTATSWHLGDFTIGNTAASPNITLHGDGRIEAVSIDGGEYAS